jgi:hypothetical protein
VTSGAIDAQCAHPAYGACIIDCELVLAIAGSSAQFQPEITVEPIIKAAARLS